MTTDERAIFQAFVDTLPVNGRDKILVALIKLLESLDDNFTLDDDDKL